MKMYHKGESGKVPLVNRKGKHESAGSVDYGIKQKGRS